MKVQQTRVSWKFEEWFALKHGFHCNDFHWTRNCWRASSSTLYNEFHPNRSRSTESAGTYSFTPVNMIVTEHIFMKPTLPQLHWDVSALGCRRMSCPCQEPNRTLRWSPDRGPVTKPHGLVLFRTYTCTLSQATPSLGSRVWVLLVAETSVQLVCPDDEEFPVAWT
jgi:hypothetical protein